MRESNFHFCVGLGFMALVILPILAVIGVTGYFFQQAIEARRETKNLQAAYDGLYCSYTNQATSTNCTGNSYILVPTEIRQSGTNGFMIKYEKFDMQWRK